MSIEQGIDRASGACAAISSRFCPPSFEDERAARVDRAAGGQSTTCAPNVRRCLHFGLSAGKLIIILTRFTVRRYFFDWLVDLAYRLAGASRLVLIHSSAPDSLRNLELSR